ncbi:MAG: hypothetical protein ACP5LW_03365 [Nitrososphaeria archaeon]
MVVITTSLILSVIALIISTIDLAFFIYIYRVYTENIDLIHQIVKSYATNAKVLEDLLGEINKGRSEVHKPTSPAITNINSSIQLDETKEEAPQINDSKLRVLSAAMEHEITARDVMSLLNVTREHASRLLAQLYAEGYLIKTNDKKPFKYTISDKGRTLLKR